MRRRPGIAGGAAVTRTGGAVKRRLALTGAMAALSALSAVATFPAPASAAGPLTWSSPVMIDNVAGEGSTSEIRGMSCIGSSECVAVGDGGKVLTTLDPADGSTAVWKAARVDGENSLNGISCLSSPSLCVGVDNQGNVVSTNDPGDGASAVWTVQKIDTGTDVSTQGSNNTLDSVSCVPSPLLCVAVDDNENVFTSTDPTAGASATWTPAAVDTANAINDLNSVSCTESPSLLCVAVDNNGNVVTSSNPAGGAADWTVTNVDGTTNVKGVSCASTTLCVAVDAAGNSLTSIDGAAATWSPQDIDGTRQLEAIVCQSSSLCAALDSKGAVVSSTNPAATPATWTIKAVEKTGIIQVFGLAISCPSTSLCVFGDLVGQAFASANPTAGSTATWTGRKVDTTDAIDSMSCPTTTLCVGVDNVGNTVTSSDPGDGASASWALAQGIDGTLRIESVSCPSASLCVAVDNSGNALTTSDPADGATALWAKENIDGTKIIDGVSCPSTSLCVAVDDAGNILTSTDPTDGASTVWSVLSVEAATVTINGVSCPSSALCVATDNQGNVLTSTDPANGASAVWTTDAVDGSNNLLAVSCASTVLCVATDSQGDVVTSTDPSGGASAFWSVLDADAVNTTNALNAVSCPSSALCVAVDQHGNVLASTDPAQGGAAGWTVAGVDDNANMTAVSCPAATLCVAGDATGNEQAGAGHELTVDLSGTGSGAVASGDGSISCSPICSSVYPPGTMVTLTATAASGSSFTGWSGGGCSGTAPCTVTMSSDQAVTANFVRNPILTVSLAGNGIGTVSSADGSISCPGTCSGNYPPGTMLTLTAPPGSDDAFTGWSGGGCSGTGTCTVTMSSDLSVTATFAFTPDLTVAAVGTGFGTIGSGDGSIDCSSTCSHHYLQGTSVTLSATADPGSSFIGWTGVCSGTGTCVVAMGADQAVDALFVANPVLTVSIAGSGTVGSGDGSIACPDTCSSSYRPGTTVGLTATASRGYTFTGWSGGGCSGTGLCFETMSSDQSVTATFAPNPTLTITTAGAGSGTVTSGDGTIACPGVCSGAYVFGTTVTLTATAHSGSIFTGWSGGGCSGTGACVVTMSSDEAVTAAFAPVPAGTTSGPGSAPSGSSAKAPSCTLKPKASARLRAQRKNGKLVRLAPPTTVKLTARCNQTAQLTLTGKVTVVPKGVRRNTRPKAKTFRIRAVSAHTSAGAALTLTVKLPPAALARGVHDAVTFILTASNANGTSSTTMKLPHLTLS